MRAHATARFEVENWDEKAYDEPGSGPKLTRASVTKAFAGDVEGESELEYLMVYRDDKHASFVGIERIVGRLGDRSGSFVLQHVGEFEGGSATADIVVVPGSGTGELSGLRGEGHFDAPQGEPESWSITLDYDID
jgi:uncharacterized protein DUF3224